MVHLIGGSTPVPFSRVFFNVTLGEILERNGGSDPHKLTLYLTDGSLLDVCEIERLADDYLSVRAYRTDVSGCDATLTLIPYSLIYRVEISPKTENNARMGFNWARPTRKLKRK